MTIRLPFRLISTGAYLPPQVVESAALEDELVLPKGYFAQRTGVERRHRVTTQTGSQLGVAAVQQALDRAGLTVEDLDVVIGASATMDYILPNRACSLLAELAPGRRLDIMTLDVDATCLSFVAALHQAALMLQQPDVRHVAIVSAEISKYGLSPENVETYGLFGDGAAAVIVGRDDSGEAGLVNFRLRSYPEGAAHCIIRGGGNAFPPQRHPYSHALYGFQMEGKQLLRLVQELLPDFLEAYGEGAPQGQNVQHAARHPALRGVDLLVPHQTSMLGFKLLERALGEERPPVVNCLAELGNCIAASIPLALDHAIQTGALQRGQTAMLLGSAAGLSLGALTFKY